MLGVCLLLAAVAPSSAWISDAALQARADNRTWTALPVFTLNLDLPQKDRWTEIGTLYKPKAPAVLAYLESILPAWAIPILETIGADVEPFFRDYGDEMIGLASALGLKVGDVVTMNLIYQLESLGLNCTNWNTTGPTVPNDPGCMDVDPTQAWCYCHNKSAELENGMLWNKKITPENAPGLCTSTVAQDLDGTIWHGRNMDWNLPDALLDMAVDVDYQRNGTTLFRGSTLVGFVGLVNGIRRPTSAGAGYSVSMNARGKGGKVLVNLLEALLYKKAMTPEQHMRKVFETQGSFQPAVKALATGPLVDELYYTVAGTQKGEGVVITRDRNDNGVTQSADLWPINASAWFRLQTNYDHWNPVPVADDRQTPGEQSMRAMGQSGLSPEALRNVMQTWPVFNHHTDYTGIFNPGKGRYESGVWLDK